MYGEQDVLMLAEEDQTDENGMRNFQNLSLISIAS